MDVEKIIKKELGKKYINQKELADALNVTVQTVTRWRNNGIIYSKQRGKMNLLDSVYIQLLKNKNFDGARRATEIFKQQERQTKLNV